MLAVMLLTMENPQTTSRDRYEYKPSAEHACSNGVQERETDHIYRR